MTPLWKKIFEIYRENLEFSAKTTPPLQILATPMVTMKYWNRNYRIISDTPEDEGSAWY
jgi:hypothetical protein